MQEFGKRIGWARGGLLVGALLLVVMGVLCFTAHGIMPEAMHNTGLSGEYAPGELIGALTMAVVGVSQIGAYYLAGGSKNLAGWLLPVGIMSLVCVVACLIDPFVGTFTYEWVIAVFIAFLGIMMALSALCGGRIIGYKGWPVELICGLVMIVLALGVVYNSAYAATMAGIAFIVYALYVASIVFMSKDLKLKY